MSLLLTIILHIQACATGHGKEGSICFFERTIRPDVFTSISYNNYLFLFNPFKNFSLNDARQFWTVGRNEDGTQKYLVVAKDESTLVLELGTEMMEVDDDIFFNKETTIAAGELASGDISVQVPLLTFFV